MDTSPATIILPAFNEAHSIEAVIQGVRKVCPQEEILVINDGSTDETEAAARTAGARVLSHPYNMGYGAAIKTGIRHARFRRLVFFDADRQHDPKDIPRLLAALSQSDMAVGARPKGSGQWGRRYGKWFLYRVANYLVGRQIPDLNSGLRAIDRDLALQFSHLLPNGFSLTTTLTLALFRSGYRGFRTGWNQHRFAQGFL